MSLFTIKNVKFMNKITYPAMEIKEGKVTFIRGKSGTGKSTLLKLLNGTVSFAEGEISYGDQPLQEQDNIALRREVLLVAQQVFLFEDTIANNFSTFYEYRKQQAPDVEKIRIYLQLCQADFPLETNCRDMSGGERQRIFVAICLSFLPRVIMLDEPTSALDDTTSVKFMESVAGFCREKKITLLVVTHDTSLAETFADEVIDLDELMGDNR